MKGNDSCVWKGILHSRSILRNGSLSLAGRGDFIDIWEQPWIPWLEYEEFMALMRNVRTRYPLLKTVADLSNSNGGVEYPDSLVWKPTKDGSFSVKEAYKAITSVHGHNTDRRLWRLIWSKYIHFRHSIMIMRALMGCLPTKDKLPFVNDKMYPLCDSASEEVMHLFWDCPLARALWFRGPFPLNLGIRTESSLADRVATRNEAIFKGQITRIDIARKNLLTRYDEAILVSKVDLEAATKWYAKSEKTASAPEAELMAIFWALQLDKELGHDSIVVLSDAQIMVKALEDRRFPPIWEIRPLAFSVLNTCNSFSFCHFCYIPRLDNSTADFITKKARTDDGYSVGHCIREGSPVVMPNFLLQ
ncbi:hypothetical protein G4B88_008367 [Cannabis sativa]|uniref:RNase H type-1 domain-containing protein n=1 Tax=Cannabis sativa TaxID=3483 RepID=A0A7J6G7S7_CANSA|nr:hypothetical protein G4B88_008367 [Cannabis sativa]